MNGMLIPKRLCFPMEFTYALGARVAGVGECGVTIHGQEQTPLFSKAPVLSDEQMQNLSEGLNELGRRAKAKGIKICFHPHVGTGIQTLKEIDKLMELTNPDLVYLLFDTGNFATGGNDAVQIIKSVKHGMFTVPGDGDCVDRDGVFAVIKNSDYKGWVVVKAEQDPAKADPLEYAQKARRFMKEKPGCQT